MAEQPSSHIRQQTPQRKDRTGATAHRPGPGAAVRGARRLLGVSLATLICLATLAVPGAAAAPVEEASSAPSAAAESLPTTDRTHTVASDEQYAALAAVAEREGTVDTFVTMRLPFTPEGSLSGDQVRVQRETIARETQRLLGSLRGTELEVAYTYRTVPAIALRLTAPALSVLRTNRLAANVALDEADESDLGTSTKLVQSAQANKEGRTGAGQYIAILDSGIDKDHPFLAGKVKREACYSPQGLCPDGLKEAVGPDTGVPCTFEGCWHGTHVAGIAAGKGPDFSGVAPEASLISIALLGKVCPEDEPCHHAASPPSVQVTALEHVLYLRQEEGLAIASLNMSYGNGVHTTACNQDPRKDIIDQLRSVGVASVAASGNTHDNTGIKAPACIPNVIAVGSTSQDDNKDLYVNDQSNSSALVDLLAPNEVVSSEPGGVFVLEGGTSMAAPHVAGAFAVMRQLKPSATVGEIEGLLESTGLPVTDQDNGVTKPFLQLMDASLPYKAHLSVGDVTSAEGNSGTKDAIFTVTRSGLATTKVTAKFATKDGTAHAPADYLAGAGQVTLQPGQMSTTVTVKVKGDWLDESNEQFGVVLSEVVGATTSSPDSLGVGTITDDDLPLSDTEWAVGEVSIDDARVIEGDNGTSQVTFTISLAKPIPNASSVKVETAPFNLDNNGEVWADEDTDYVPKSEIVVFQANETSKTFTVTVKGDTEAEPIEVFDANLSNPSHLTMVKSSGRGSIIDDD